VQLIIAHDLQQKKIELKKDVISSQRREESKELKVGFASF